MVKWYRWLYFRLLKLSISAQLDYWYNKGCRNIFFYERSDTPDGVSLSKFVEADVDVKVGGIKWLFVLRGLFLVGPSRSMLTIYTGNVNSICLVDMPCVFEIQHGLLDDSYFNGRRPSVFLARSEHSADIYRRFRSDVKVITISFDLDAPRFVSSSLMNFRSFAFYSKNPGGGISQEDLCNMELQLVSLIPSLRLHLHPRDNLLKLAIRSRLNLRLLRCYLHTIFLNDDCGPRLVISSYSSALYDRVVSGDYVLNLESRCSPSEIQKLVFGSLPTCYIGDLCFLLKGEVKVARIL